MFVHPTYKPTTPTSLSIMHPEHIVITPQTPIKLKFNNNVNCKHGLGLSCHRLKNNKCPFVHPVPLTPPAILTHETPSAPVKSKTNKLINCKHGLKTKNVLLYIML